MKRTKTLRFRVTPNEAQRLKKLATDAGFAHYSEYVRTSCFYDSFLKEKIDSLDRYGLKSDINEEISFVDVKSDGEYLRRNEVLEILNYK